MYDASIGRWFTEDPIAFEGGDADLYRYVGNDPTNAIDPTGMKAEPGVKKDGAFDKGKVFFRGWPITSAIDVVRADKPAFYGTLAGIGGLGQDAKPVEIGKADFGDGKNIRVGVRSGMDVYIWAELNRGEDVKKYYWRQYVTVSVESKNPIIKKLASPRELDGGNDKYPTTYNEKDLSVSMRDRPGPIQKADLIKAKALSVMVGDKNVTVALPNDGGRLAKGFINQVNAVYGMSGSVLEYKYTTELVYNGDAGKIVKGSWEWGVKVSWKKEGEIYTPIVEPTVGNWKK